MLVYLFFSVASISLNAQSFKVKAVIDTTRIKIGDQVRLSLEVDQPKNAKVTFPLFSDTITSKIDVVNNLKADTIVSAGNLHIKKDYVITSFDSGYHQVNPLVFVITVAGKTDTLRSDPLFLQVFTLPVDTTKEIREIKPVFGVPITFADIWIYLVVALGVIIIGFAIWYFIKQRKNEPFFAIRKAQEPPHIIALSDLDALRAEKLWQQGKEKLYYTRLTEIIRVYLEQRYHLLALEMTSDETLQAFKSLSIENPADIDLLKVIFLTADLVKFAKANPLPNENEICLLNAYQFINNTKVFDQADNKAEETEDLGDK